ncbi:hypothetical protein [Kribbella catacumbae]|uniref:hypothetical protein n=1 Tax=Kribbella catacumbae TaxID=460086 RepID=UPI00036FAFEE|nr:hypothetical protein [Kribbella catacumbae]
MDSLVIQTIVGLLLIFAGLSVVVSVVTEGATRFIGLRGEYLLRGIRSLVDGPTANQIMMQPMVARTADKGVLPDNAGNTALGRVERRKLPSYLSGRSFARSFLDVLVPDISGTTTVAQVRTKVVGWEDDNALKKPLLSLLAEAGDDIGKFREGLEQWYDDHMDRVTGWYKRHVRWISLGVATVMVLLFNVNAIGITRSLYTDEALRETVVTQAANSADCSNKDAGDCLSDLRTEIQKVRASGLPIGWGPVSACAAPDASCNWFEQRGFADPDQGTGQDIQLFLLVLAGWALMVAATVPGARFWFDALSRLGSLRSTGPKPSSR